MQDLAWVYRHERLTLHHTVMGILWLKVRLDVSDLLQGHWSIICDQVGVEFSTNSPWWSWAFRHACFLLNRFSPTRGATAYELLYNKAYGGAVCNFGEPVYGFANVTGKGTAKWRRMVVIHKTLTCFLMGMGWF